LKENWFRFGTAVERIELGHQLEVNINGGVRRRRQQLEEKMETKTQGEALRIKDNPSGDLTTAYPEKTDHERYLDALDVIEALRTEQEAERMVFRAYREGAELREERYKAKIEAYREVVAMRMGGGR
jgi:hypothetical protein